MNTPTSHIRSVGTQKPGSLVSPLGPHVSPKGFICYVNSDLNIPNGAQGMALCFTMVLGSLLSTIPALDLSPEVKLLSRLRLNFITAALKTLDLCRKACIP